MQPSDLPPLIAAPFRRLRVRRGTCLLVGMDLEVSLLALLSDSQSPILRPPPRYVLPPDLLDTALATHTRVDPGREDAPGLGSRARSRWGSRRRKGGASNRLVESPRRWAKPWYPHPCAASQPAIRL